MIRTATMEVYRVKMFHFFLEKGQKKHATWVRDATGVSGRGYKHEREYVVKMQIPLTVEEQAPVFMSSLWCLNVFV